MGAASPEVVSAAASTSGIHHALLAGILLLAAAVRLPQLGREAFSQDELFSQAASAGYLRSVPPLNVVLQPPPLETSILERRPVRDAIRGMILADAHPPLYHLLLRGWRELLGDGEAVSRSLSVLFSLLSILLLFDAVRSLHDEEAALWAALFAALAGPHVYYAREARSYALLVLMTLAAAASAARIYARGPSPLRCVTLGSSLFLAMLTHYQALGFLAGLFAWSLLAFDRRSWRPLFVTVAIASVAFALLWGPFLLQQAPHVGVANAWNVDALGGHGRLWSRVLPLPLQVLFTTRREFAARSALLGASWLAAAFVALRRPQTRLWAATGATALGFLALMDAAWGSAQLSFTRYALVATSPACALLAAASLPGKGLRRQLVRCLGAALMLAVLPAVYEPWRPQWKEWGRQLKELAPDTELVLLSQVGMGGVTRWIFEEYAWSEKRRLLLFAGPLGAEARRGLGPRFWLIAQPSEDPHQLVPGAELVPRIRMKQSPVVYEGHLTGPHPRVARDSAQPPALRPDRPPSQRDRACGP